MAKAKIKKKKRPITWSNAVVRTDRILKTPNNFKLVTEDGSARFNTSLNDYGKAGTVILNYHPTKKGYYFIVDGNSRHEDAVEQGEETMNASIPSRALTPKEYEEFSAMYDMARKGEVDLFRIKEELGTSKDFFKKWGFSIDDATASKLDNMDGGKIEAKPKKGNAETPAIETRPISLLFTPEESDQYIKMAEALYKRYKVDNVTDLSMKIMKQTYKQK